MNEWERLLKILSTMNKGKNIMIGAWIAEFGDIPEQYKAEIDQHKEL